MKLSTVFKTNLFIVLVLALGFAFLSAIYYHSLYENSKDTFKLNASERLSLLVESLDVYFSRPSYISRSMAANDFLVNLLSAEHKRDEKFDKIVTNYVRLSSNFSDVDGGFLVVVPEGWFYTQDGYVSRITKENLEHSWYQYSSAIAKDDVNIDIDKTPSANNEESLFFNYKILGENRRILGVTGLCVHLDRIQNMLKENFKRHGSEAWIINEDGMIEIASATTGLAEINFFDLFGNDKIRDYINTVYDDWKITGKTMGTFFLEQRHSCLAVKYIPELSWYLLLETKMEDFYMNLRQDIMKAAAIIISVMLLITMFISRIIFHFEKKVIVMQNEQQRYFYDATRCMYFSIYEINVSRNIFTVDSKNRQFRLSPVKDRILSYSDCLNSTVESSVKEDFRKSFFDKFRPDSIIKSFHDGVRVINYNCPVFFDDKYQWLHFNAHLFLKEDDKSVFMYLYVKNINKEMEDKQRSELDGLTQCLLRSQTEKRISDILKGDPTGNYAFFIVDMDNLKGINDTYGHVFGDYCIKSFAKAIKGTFRSSDIIGRIGGDEFVIFIPYQSRQWLEERAQKLSEVLSHPCASENVCYNISGSIGIALCPDDGSDFVTLYACADKALYKSKTEGRRTFNFYKPDLG